MRGYRHLIGLLVAGAMLLLPAIADAAGGFEYVQKSTTVPANSSASRTARCPSHTQSVGGGVFISGSSLEVEVTSSFPLDYTDRDGDGDDGWVGTGNAGPTQETMTVHAICAKRGTFVYERSSFKAVNPGQQKGAKARCPDGTDAIGGGVSTAGDTSTDFTLVGTVPVGVSDGHPDNDAWKGFTENGSTHKIEMATYVTCARHAAATSSQIYNGIPVFLNNTQDQLDTSPCPDPAFHPSGGGGVVIGAPSGTEVASTAPATGNTTWQTYFNNQSGLDQRMSVYLVCTKLKS